MSFDGNVALITSGTAGIGEAAVRLVASLGACVGLLYGVSEDAEYVVEQIVDRDEEGERL
jgi:NAD(P)-dependent dehydrogenase (short-subunit alcohol dehydrogenase family)